MYETIRCRLVMVDEVVLVLGWRLIHLGVFSVKERPGAVPVSPTMDADRARGYSGRVLRGVNSRQTHFVKKNDEFDRRASRTGRSC